MSDTDIRLAAFDWLAEQVAIHGDVLPWNLLAKHFSYKGEHVALLSQQGIFKPKLMELPLSLRTSVGGPYDDSFGQDGLLRYRYRGDELGHRDNRGLREAMRRGVPLIYFHGIVPAKYLAVWPVFIVGDDPATLTFKVAVDDAELATSLLDRTAAQTEIAEYDSSSRRQYVTALVKRRLHQRAFRERVLSAYQRKCSLCRLRHTQLLDAAHIIPDPEELGEPRVANGISLCKLHHAAFDAFFLAIRPDYRIEVQPSILEESDGPMLLHGLQELHDQPISIPRTIKLRPDPELLHRRYERFLAAQR